MWLRTSVWSVAKNSVRKGSFWIAQSIKERWRKADSGPGDLTLRQKIHLYLSGCCFSPVKNPHTAGNTQIKEDRQWKEFGPTGSVQHQTLLTVQLDSSAWEPGELASGNTHIFLKLCVTQNFLGQILFFIDHIILDLFFNPRKFLDLSFPSVGL